MIRPPSIHEIEWLKRRCVRGIRLSQWSQALQVVVFLVGCAGENWWMVGGAMVGVCLNGWGYMKFKGIVRDCDGLLAKRGHTDGR